MKPYYDHAGVAIYHGDVKEVLASMESESVNCCVTSPPYWGLRDYGTAEWSGGNAECDHRKVTPGTASIGKSTLGPRRDGISGQATNGHQQEGFKSNCGKCGAARIDKQIGLEATPEQYVAKMVEVFREVRRVLRPDATVWLNLGDSYATGAGKVGNCPGGGVQGERWAGYRGTRDDSPKHSNGAMGPMIQPNRMPIPGLKPKDLVGIPWRVAFALQADGWWLRSDIIWAKPAPMPESVTDRPTRSHEHIFLLAKSETYYYDADAIAEPAKGWNGSRFDDARDLSLYPNIGRKPRSAYRDTSKNGIMDAQHSGRRMVDNVARARANGGDHDSPFGDTRNKRDVWTVNTEPFPDAHFAVFPSALIRPCILAGAPAGGTILDPFMGAGTTALVAKQNGRRSIGIELNESYIAIAARRLSQDVLEFV